jgi:hypothetical protein
MPEGNKAMTPEEKERQKRQEDKARAARRAIRRQTLERKKNQKKQQHNALNNPNREKADSFSMEATHLEDQGDWIGAERNVMLALAFQPDSKALKESLKRLRAKLRDLKK